MMIVVLELPQKFPNGECTSCIPPIYFNESFSHTYLSTACSALQKLFFADLESKRQEENILGEDYLE